MRSAILFFFLMAASAGAWAVNWQPLPSTADYQSTIDLDSIKSQKGYAQFLVHHAFYTGQQDATSGKEYFTTREQYLADCKAGTAILVITQFYGEDKKLFRFQGRQRFKKSDFKAPDAGTDVAAAMTTACERIAQGGVQPGQPGTGKVRITRTSSGSGIVINRDGVILTNQHVVRQCTSYEVIDDNNRKLTAALQTVDAASDLALLTVKERFPAAAPLRKETEPKLGEDVTVVGYPLVSVLGTRPSVGFGQVASTVGVRGNPAQMQISVPVQRGNSGGPVLDKSGNVIGVVVSKLNALKMAQRTGDIPQNVNFAIRGDTVHAFLKAHNVDYTAADDSAKLENTEIASRGAAFTVRVVCIRDVTAQ